MSARFPHTGGRRRSPTVAAMALIAVVLGGCAATTGPRTSEQAALDNYAASYSAQGAAVGAVGGAIAGCVIGSLIRDDIEGCVAGGAIGAVGGGVAGAIGGSVVAANQQQYASREAELGALHQAASEELRKAREARQLATRVVAGHRSTIARLTRQEGSSATARAQLSEELATARRDRDQMKAISDGLKQQIEVLEREGGGDPQLRRQRDELRAEVARLDDQIAALTSTIATADGMI